MTEDLLILGELIAEHAAHMDAAEHRLLTNIRDFDQRDGWASASSCAHWLAWRVGWSLSTAREHVRVAKALGSLPHIDEALRVGKVSYCKVRAMTRVATPANEQVLLMDAQLTTGSQLERVCRKYRQLQRNEKGASPAADDVDRFLRRRDLDNGMVCIEAVCHPEEAALIWAAIEQATKELLAARQAEERAAADSEADSTDVSAETCTGEASDSADACVSTCASTADVSAESCTCAADSVGAGEALASAEGLDTAEDLDADEVYEDDCAFFERFGVCPEPRPEPVLRAWEEAPISSARGQRFAKPEAKSSAKSIVRWKKPAKATFNRLDGLLALMRKVSMGESLKSPVEVVVTVSAEALAKRAAPEECIAFLNDDGCISAEAARRMACDAGIVFMVEDENGNPLSVERRTRSIPTSVARGLAKRDTCCRFPGCTNKVFLDGHHLKH